MEIVSGRVFIKNMKFHARHGVLPQERVAGGEFTVSLSVNFNPCDAVESDNVADTLNYAKIYQTVKREMQKPSALIEHVAGRIGKSILDTMPKAETVEITVCKTNPPMGADADCAGVELKIKRQRK